MKRLNRVCCKWRWCEEHQGILAIDTLGHILLFMLMTYILIKLRLTWWSIVILCNLIGYGIEELEIRMVWDRYCKWMDSWLYGNLKKVIPDRVARWVMFGGKSNILSIKDMLTDNKGMLLALWVWW